MRCKGRACYQNTRQSAWPVVIRQYVWKLPVSSTNVTSVVCWNAAAVDDYSQDDEAYASNDLHQAENEFDLSNHP